MRYVLYVHTRYQDGSEDGAKVYGTIDAALADAARYKGGINPHNTTVRLYELGREIPIVMETVEEPQPSKKTVRFAVRPNDAGPPGEDET